VTPRIDPRRFGLNDVGEAYRIMKEGSARGKLVIEVGSSSEQSNSEHPLL
jgi:NADPH:quinone reductase-like Zn-dependent oxidoreductase